MSGRGGRRDLRPSPKDTWKKVMSLMSCIFCKATSCAKLMSLVPNLLIFFTRKQKAVLIERIMGSLKKSNGESSSLYSRWVGDGKESRWSRSLICLILVNHSPSKRPKLTWAEAETALLLPPPSSSSSSSSSSSRLMTKGRQLFRAWWGEGEGGQAEFAPLTT